MSKKWSCSVETAHACSGPQVWMWVKSWLRSRMLLREEERERGKWCASMLRKPSLNKEKFIKKKLGHWQKKKKKRVKETEEAGAIANPPTTTPPSPPPQSPMQISFIVWWVQADDVVKWQAEAGGRSDLVLTTCGWKTTKTTTWLMLLCMSGSPATGVGCRGSRRQHLLTGNNQVD